MKKLFVFCVLATALSAQGAINVAATKQYVDAKDAATLEASTNYTDAVAITKADLVQYSVVTNGSAVVTNAIPVVYSNVLTQVVSGYVGTNDFIDATNDLATAINSKASPSDIYDAVTNKADKVNSATNGHFAALNSSGNLMDSGIAASDVLVNNGTANGGITFDYGGESSSQLDGLGLIIDDSLSGYKAFYNADRIDLAFNHGSLYSLQFPTRGGILALTSDLSRYVGTNDFITATNGLATAINSKASPSDIAVKSVELNGTALTPDATGAVNVQALPLTGGTMTGDISTANAIWLTNSGMWTGILQINGDGALQSLVGGVNIDASFADIIKTANGSSAHYLGNSGNQTLDGNLQVGDNAKENIHLLKDTATVVAEFVKNNHSQYKHFIPSGTKDDTISLLSDIYAAVQQIAPAWVSGTSYAANALVTYNGVVYQNTSGATIQNATTPNTSGSGWTAKKVSELILPLTGGTVDGLIKVDSHEPYGVAVAEFVSDTTGFKIFPDKIMYYDDGVEKGILALLQNLAPNFSTSATYAVNNLCVYVNRLYRCTTAHQGAWNSSHFTEATVEDVLAAIWTALGEIPSWAKTTNKPSYTLNEVCPNTENWLGVPGTTAAGKSIKVLAKTVNGVIEGGLTVTGSSNNDNDITKYRYGGVTVTRDGVVTDYLFDTTSESGIVRRSELNDKAPLASPAFTGTPTAPTPTSGDNSTNVATTAFIQGALPYAIATVDDDNGYIVVSDRCVNRFDATSFASATINIIPPDQTAGKSRDFYVAVTCGATIPSVAVVGAFIDYTLINSKGESADLTLTANATTVLHFTEIANGSTGVNPVFVVTGGADCVTPLSGQTFDFATMQGIFAGVKACIEALGGSVTNAPSTTISQGE